MDNGLSVVVPYDLPGYAHEGRRTCLYGASDDVRPHIARNTSCDVSSRYVTAFPVRRWRQTTDDEFPEGVTSEHVLGILNPCTNIRKVGIYGGQFDHISSVAETMLLSLRSRHISVIYVEIVETLLNLQVDTVWNDRGWQQLEDFLCKLAEEREDNGEPLVLELGIWRNPQLESGPLDPGTILPRFRKKGLIRFAAPPEDPDFASTLNVKYSDWGIAVGLPLMLSGLFAGGI